MCSGAATPHTSACRDSTAPVMVCANWRRLFPTEMTSGVERKELVVAADADSVEAVDSNDPLTRTLEIRAGCELTATDLVESVSLLCGARSRRRRHQDSNDGPLRRQRIGRNRREVT